jgi:hypothetical protein
VVLSRARLEPVQVGVDLEMLWAGQGHSVALVVTRKHSKAIRDLHETKREPLCVFQICLQGRFTHLKIVRWTAT